jgi:hypothetical protein
MKLGPKTWTIADAKSVTLDGDGYADLGKLNLITLVDIEGRDAFALFTTEVNANSYIKATNEDKKAVAVTIRNLGVLADFLKDLLDADIAERITLDPSNKTGTSNQAPLREFLAGLVNDMKSQ